MSKEIVTKLRSKKDFEHSGNEKRNKKKIRKKRKIKETQRKIKKKEEKYGSGRKRVAGVRTCPADDFRVYFPRKGKVWSLFVEQGTAKTQFAQKCLKVICIEDGLGFRVLTRSDARPLLRVSPQTAEKYTPV